MPAKYLEKVIEKFKTGKTTEHSFRGDLQELIENTVKGIQAINEPRRQKCGAPDYIIQKKNIPIGYIEAKDIDKDLDRIENDEQLTRYKKSLDNLILTNYLEFRFFYYGEKKITVKIAELENGKIKINEKEFNNLINLIRNFCDFQGQTIKSAKQLAEMMAQKAVMMKDVLEKAVKENDDNSLKNQLNAFKTILLHDLDEHTFADMYAQTVAYGLFVARLNDKTLEDFSRQEARELISKNNPFLRQLFDYISGVNLDDRVVWIVDDLVEIFKATDLNKLLKNFGQSTMQKDPFLHFYETFLDKYDKEVKENRGVYYTPLPVVKFIVRAVDDILKTDFNLQHGLADTTKIKNERILYYQQEKKRKTVKGKTVYEIQDVPVTQKEDIYKVQILDPATGTGTFLSEIITKIYEKFVNQKGLWNQYVDEALIPRLHGFEILMTPYVMCHLKLDLLLQETGYITTNKTKRFNVYLTNSLEKDDTKQYPLFDWLADEAKHSRMIKNDTPIMVVIGNPPYSGESASGDTFNEELEEYKKEATGEKLKEKNSKWINDDYVKFIRLAQMFTDKNNEGVIAYVNNHSFLDNPTFRGMRYNLLKSFDKIYIIDLHGNAKKNETCPDGSKDENVFNIQQGVSINIFIKTGQKKKNELAKIYHKDLCGKKQIKYDYLDTNLLNDVDFQELQPENPYYFFVPKNFGEKKEYDKGFGVNELFKINSVGVVTARDNFCIKNSKEEVSKTINDFVTLDTEDARKIYNLGDDVRDWKIEFAKQDLLSSKLDNNNVVKISYRPFDDRYTYYTGKSKGFHCMPRGEVMKNFVNKENLGITLCKQVKAFDSYQHIFLTKNIMESSFVSNKTSEITSCFSLYVYPETDQKSFFEQNRTPNLNMDIVKEFEQKLKLTFTTEKEETSNTFAPIDIWDYIYGVLHSNKYREKFKEFLKIDFPKIPYPISTDYFFRIGALGKQIREIHLLESPKVNEFITSYPIVGNNEIEKFEYKENKVYINSTQYFDNVSQEAWEFYIGGYQPAQKWLKDRKGRILSFEDLMHYQKIIVALTETNRLMQQIDEAIEV